MNARKAVASLLFFTLFPVNRLIFFLLKTFFFLLRFWFMCVVREYLAHCYEIANIHCDLLGYLGVSAMMKFKCYSRFI